MLKMFILLRKTTMNNKVKLKQEMMKKKKHYHLHMTCVYKTVIKPWLTGKKIMKIKIET